MKKYNFIFILFTVSFYIISLFYGVTYLRSFMRDFERKYTSNSSSVSLEKKRVYQKKNIKQQIQI